MKRDLRFVKPELVRACAGAGKTYELSTRYIELLSAGETPERILATTFTRKAAGEILERIYLRLADAAADSRIAKELAFELGQPKFSCADAISLLSKIISVQHRLHIQTLDSFFAAITKSFSLELGLAPAWRIESEADQKLLVRGAISELCAGGKHKEILEFIRLLSRKEFTRSVHQFLEEELTKLLEIVSEAPKNSWGAFAVPNPPPAQHLNLAKKELQEFDVPRTKKENQPHKRWSIAKEKLNQLIKEGDWDGLLENPLVSYVKRGNLSYDRVPIPDGLASNIRILLQEIASRLLSRLKLQSQGSSELLSLISQRYIALRDDRGILFHSDLKSALDKGLKQAAWEGGLDELYYRLDSRLHHLLLDEFQDTSRVDWSVLYPIVDEVLSKSGPEHTFFCVGDTKQAIYGWRGGVAGIFDSITGNWPQVSATSRDETYRLSPAVTETVNKVFLSLKQNPALIEFGTVAESWSSRFDKHTNKRTKPLGYSCFVDLSSADETIDLKFEILSKLQELHSANPAVSVAILVRSNKQISEIMGALALSKFDLQISEESGNPLTDSEAVNLLLSLLIFIDHPGDSLAAFHL